MGYCTSNDIQKIIAQALTSATAGTSDGFGTYANLMNIGNTMDKNLVSADNVNYYIQLADSEIDGALSQLYITPFCEKCDFESVLYSPVSEYNSYIVLENFCPIAAGDIVVISDGKIEERHQINEVIDGRTFSTSDPILYFFPEGSRILRVSYPPPIRFVSARIAAANIYDKYFSSESSPNTSAFGNQIRELAYNRINEILDGTIILHGQERIGRRFYNPTLVEQYGLPSGGSMANDKRQSR